MYLRNSLLLLVSMFWHWRTDAANGTRNVKVLNWTVTVSNQSQLDQFINNVTASSDKGDTNNIHLSLAGDNTYILDIVKLMKINTTDSSLIMKSNGGPAKINCTASQSEQDLQPISRASVVQMDGLIFTGCPVPIMIEETSNVKIQDCVFQ